MCYSSSVVELRRVPTMSPRLELITLLLVLTLNGRVYMVQIIGGHEVVPHSRPYMVALEMHRDNNEKQFCAGFLLNEDFVMTAAHCQATSYQVLLGVHSFWKLDDVQRIPVEQAFPHKEYNSTSYENDIMLLKLGSKAKFSQNVKPIALGGKTGDALPKSCSVSGWGRTDKNSYLSEVLMEVNVTLVEDENCEHQNVYCSKGKTGPYIGDSGGPLVCENGEAYGVISFINEKTSDGVDIYAFSKISDHRWWIYRTIRNA